MIRKDKNPQGTGNRFDLRRNSTFLLLLLSLLALAQFASAQDNEPGATPVPADEDSSAFIDVVPTDVELLGMPATIDRYLAAHTLPAGLLQPAELSESTKTSSKDLVSPNGLFDYTIEIKNTGDFDIPAEMTDLIPDGIEFIEIDCVAFISDRCEITGSAAEWEGLIIEGGVVTITIQARVTGDAEPGTIIENTAKIESAEQTINRSAEITVDELKASPIQFIPFTIYGLLPDPQPITLTGGQPNSQNAWQLTWSQSPGATGFEIHESNDPNFNSPTPYVVGQVNQLSITKQPTPSNVFYYRARSLVGQTAGPWSNVVTVVGGYRDDFNDPGTGWSVRRSTYLEEVKGFYENGRYVMQVNSRWDWGIVSPLRPAPRVPYAIDFEARIISLGYAHSAGAVFGGDWSGEACPPGTSFDQWYKHDKCFNHFYNTNSIFNDTIANNPKIGLLFERIDRLEWCLGCGGSPMKRLGDISNLRDYRNIDADDWNHYRIEVRPDSIRVYAAEVGQTPVLQYEYTDTRWINNPYFGFFTSTDVIENATWRFEYMQVMPLD